MLLLYYSLICAVIVVLQSDSVVPPHLQVFPLYLYDIMLLICFANFMIVISAIIPSLVVTAVNLDLFFTSINENCYLSNSPTFVPAVYTIHYHWNPFIYYCHYLWNLWSLSLYIFTITIHEAYYHYNPLHLLLSLSMKHIITIILYIYYYHYQWSILSL
jgi:hypothetical protein